MLKVSFLFFLLLSSFAGITQVTIIKDIEISQMVNEVSADSMKSYINTLVNFGTRNTLSTQTSKTRGIGAARNWVYNKFLQFSGASNGRLTVFIDTTTLQPDKRRVDSILLLGNVVAT